MVFNKEIMHVRKKTNDVLYDTYKKETNNILSIVSPP
jgi:hypothetical protein